MNKAILIGRVTKDIEVKRTTTGKAVAVFALAVNRDYKNENGEYDADFITCVAYEQRAETIGKYVRKGDKFGVIGKIATHNYEKNGSKVYITEIIVEGFEFLESKKEKSVDIEPDDFEEVDDDDLPF